LNPWTEVAKTGGNESGEPFTTEAPLVPSEAKLNSWGVSMMRKCCCCFAFLFPSLDSSDDEGSDTEVVQNSHPPRTRNESDDIVSIQAPLDGSETTSATDSLNNSEDHEFELLLLDQRNIKEGSCNLPINNPQTVQKVDNSSQVSLAFSVHKIKHSCKYAKRTPDYKKKVAILGKNYNISFSFFARKMVTFYKNKLRNVHYKSILIVSTFLGC
jgi:hypothetical protein